MAKKIIALLFLLFGLNGFSQSDSAKTAHYFYISFDDWLYDDTHTMYGYGFSKGKHHFHAGLSIERKRLPRQNSNYYWYYLNFESFGDFTLKDTNFSITTNAVTVGYSYLFKEKNRLTFYPFVNLYVNYFRTKGVFEGQLENGVSGTDKYRIARWHYLGILGWGCRYKINSKLTAKFELGAGLGMTNFYYNSEYFGSYSDWGFWGYGFGRLGLYYRFK